MTLGASRSSIVLLLLTQLWWPTVAGLLIGFGAAVPVTELLERDPFYLQTLDLSVHTTVIACMAMTVGIAALYPALRAMRSDPVNALRHE